MKKDKKGIAAIQLIIALVLGLVVLSIYLVVGLSVNEELQNSQTVNSTAYNATSDIQTEMAEIPDWIGIIVIVVIAVGIIGLLKLFKVF